MAREKIKFLAEKHGRSTSAEIVTAVEAWLDQHADEMKDFASDFEPTAEEQAEIAEMVKNAERRALESILLKRRKQ